MAFGILIRGGLTSQGREVGVAVVFESGSELTDSVSTAGPVCGHFCSKSRQHIGCSITMVVGGLMAWE